MEPMELALGEVLLRAEGGVLEVFQWVFEGSFRVPVRWLSVEAEARKHDIVRLRIGRATQLGAPIYGDGASVSPIQTMVEIPAADEPKVRAFLTAVAPQASAAAPPPDQV